jgi:hypothetical protein
VDRLTKAGDRYGKLVTVKFKYSDSRSRKFWECVCDCGGKVVTHSGLLRSGNTRSCGCLAAETAAKRRKPRNGGEVTAIILGYKRHAIGRGYCWELPREYVADMLVEPCFYCGAPPSNKKVTKNSIAPFLYNGIDRVDNNIGYVVLNVVPCCSICNRAKNTLTLSEFQEWMQRVSARYSQKEHPVCQPIFTPEFQPSSSSTPGSPLITNARQV